MRAQRRRAEGIKPPPEGARVARVVSVCTAYVAFSVDTLPDRGERGKVRPSVNREARSGIARSLTDRDASSRGLPDSMQLLTLGLVNRNARRIETV